MADFEGSLAPHTVWTAEIGRQPLCRVAAQDTSQTCYFTNDTAELFRISEKVEGRHGLSVDLT